MVSALKATCQFHPDIYIQEVRVLILTPKQKPSKCLWTEDLNSTISATDMTTDEKLQDKDDQKRFVFKDPCAASFHNKHSSFACVTA